MHLRSIICKLSRYLLIILHNSFMSRRVFCRIISASTFLRQLGKAWKQLVHQIVTSGYQKESTSGGRGGGGGKKRKEMKQPVADINITCYSSYPVTDVSSEWNRSNIWLPKKSLDSPANRHYTLTLTMSDVHCANIFLVLQVRAKRYFMASIKFSGNSKGIFFLKGTSQGKPSHSREGCRETAGSHNQSQRIDIETMYKIYVRTSHFPWGTQNTLQWDSQNINGYNTQDFCLYFQSWLADLGAPFPIKLEKAALKISA